MNQYLKILVVDDEADSRETYKMLLESQGYTAAVASSAEEAMEKTRMEMTITTSRKLVPQRGWSRVCLRTFSTVRGKRAS